MANKVTHWHECRDCGNEIPGGAGCNETGPEDCNWGGGNDGCTCG